MENCPPARSLERLLGEELSDPELARLAAHVEECPACQETLNSLTSSDPWPTPRHFLSALSEPSRQEMTAEGEAFLHRLKQRVLAIASGGWDRDRSRLDE